MVSKNLSVSLSVCLSVCLSVTNFDPANRVSTKKVQHVVHQPAQCKSKIARSMDGPELGKLPSHNKATVN